MSKSLVSKRLKANIFARDGWRCQYCGRDVCAATATVDHITPVSLGGESSGWNLRTACRACNCTRQNRSIEWLRMFFALAKTRYADVITIDQYQKLQHLGAKLDPLPVEPFFFELEQR